MKKENVDNEEIFDITNEIAEEDRTIEKFKKFYPNKFDELEETLLNYRGEIDLKNLKTELLDNMWKHLISKLNYPYEVFKSNNGYQKPLDNLKKEDFFSKSKNDHLVINK